MNDKAIKYIKKSMKMNHIKKSDVVMTPEWIAKDIINHFNPTGVCLDPCRGDGAFYNNFPGQKEWCEINENKDFFLWDKKVDWVISNPPYSNMVPFIIKGMEISNNVVYYLYADIYWTKARINIIQEFGFHLHEIYFIQSKKEDNFPIFGRALAAVHLKKGPIEPIIINSLNY